ncbi:MAG: hypothetical protein PHN69_05135 [Candidatus Pacebacteria bacterium]|nr:hypothetical protein [Candidatus Paceibacterota bacterium]
MELLKNIYNKYTNNELSEKFFPDRTPRAIRTMANKNGLIKNINKNNKWYNKNNMIIQLKNLAQKLNRTPKSYELTLYGLPSEASYRRYFGSYKDVCVLADLDINIYLFGEKRKINKSINGDICFSEAEVVITDYFILNDIPYKKEEYYKNYIDDDRCNTKKCDWVIYNNIFVEYFGLPDKPYYYKKMEVKKSICKDNGIILIGLQQKDLQTLNAIFNSNKIRNDYTLIP